MDANATYPANLCSFSGDVEFASLRENFSETVGQTIQAAARSAVRQVAPEHLHDVLSGEQCVNDAVQAGTGGRGMRCRLGRQVPRVLVGPMQLALQVRQDHVEIQHGHLGRCVAE